MKRDPEQDRRRLEGFFRDELRLAAAESPSFDDVAAYVDERLDPEARAALEERIAGDPALRHEVEDLRLLRHQMRGAGQAARRRWPVVFAGLAAAAAVAAVALWLGRPGGRGPVESGPPPSLAAAPVIALKDGDLRAALAADPALRDTIAGALRGALPAPHGLASLRSEPTTLLGGPGVAAAFGPETPVGTRVASDRPAFRWSARPDARSYEVAVFDPYLRKQAASGPIRGTQWTPERPLPRGHTYLWQVTAVTARGRVTAPAPPAPEARFEVVDAVRLAELERRRAAAPGSRLLSAVVFTEAGLLDDADAELQALAADNPGSPTVARLLEALRDLRVVTPAAFATPRR